MKLHVLPLLMLVFFVCCRVPDAKPKNGPVKPDTPSHSGDNSGKKTYAGNFILIGDSLLIPPIEINVETSAKAAKKLQENKETMLVSAFYTGRPKDTTTTEFMENGEASVATASREIAAAGIVRFDSVKFSKAMYDALADKHLALMVNVYSGRRAFKDNLLRCDIVYGNLDSLQQKRFLITCRLIYGEDSVTSP